MNRPKLRAPHLGHPRPVPVSRAVTGPIRLVLVVDRKERAAMIAATFTGLVALGALIVGLVVIS